MSWTDVPGWPGVSVTPTGEIRGPSGKVLRPLASDDGYRYVMIRRRRLRVHHAVLLAFVGPRPDGAETRHLNDDPADNRVDNLAWGTRSDNVRDRLANGGYANGEDSAAAKLTLEQVRSIRADRRSSRVVGAAHGVSHTTVLDIRRGVRWAHSN
jgi:hypothetical protein